MKNRLSFLLLLALALSLSLSLAACLPTGTPPADPACVHTDGDDNGLCDDCGGSVIIVLDLFAVNDLHGKLCDTDLQAGVDEMSTYFRAAREGGAHVLLLSSGDMWQGSAESNLTYGAIVTDWMNELDFAAMTLGNHEFDWGEEYIEENAALAEFPFLAINVYDKDTNRRASYCEASVTVEYGGATVGIIGAIGDCYSSISADKTEGVYFKTGTALTDLVRAEATRLREAGADFIVYSLHDGHGSSSSGEIGLSDAQLRAYYDPILSDGYVDIVFEGHSHQRYVARDSEGVYHLQGGGDNRGITHAEAVINFASGSTEVREAAYLPASTYDTMADDPVVDSLMEKYREQVAEAGRVLGQNDRVRDGNWLRQKAADLYLQAGLARWGGYDIVLGGGYMSVRSPGNLAAGEVIYGQLQMLFPFDNDLVLCSVSGAKLLERFINSTHEDYFISYSAYGASVRGQIEPNGIYYIVTDTYSSLYTPNGLTEVARYTPGVYARDLLADYIEGGGMTAATGGQITYTSIPEILSRGAGLADNAETAEVYYVRGRVQSVVNTTWGNLYISDEQGNTLYVYGTYSENGAIRYDAMDDPPVEGDTVILCAPIKKYVKNSNVTIELIDARVIPVA